MDVELAPFENRLRKNARHFLKWAKRHDLEAFRIYDRDIPEFPYAVDWYGGRVQLAEFPRRRPQDRTASEEAVRAAVSGVLDVPSEKLFWKTHLPKAWGKEQYQQSGARGERFTVREQGLTFWVNLTDYLDTGLFMDHRNTRARVRSEAKGKRFLNLFAYTGAFTAYAAAGGAESTLSVDLSNTYCDWAVDNLELNGLWDDRQVIQRADVLAWLSAATEKAERWDLIVLDPPPFSASKNMQRRFNVQQDQVRLLKQTTSLLSPGGVLYFSTNFKGFSLKEASLPQWHFEELTPQSIPEDFHDRHIHRCWRISAG